ncbi:MAG: hypothetical protein K2G53_03560, partial [Muribaculaceae bacterium]|nr:hypothetical protein [Muribaculaceae bacterium]
WGLGEGLAWIVNQINGVEDAANDAADGLEKVTEKQRTLDDTLRDATAQITQHIAELKNWKGSKDQEQAKVEELNRTYGNTLGTFSSVKDWYSKLTSASELYCEQMVLEAEARMLANEIADKMIQKRNLEKNAPKPIDFGGTQIETPGVAAMHQGFSEWLDKDIDESKNALIDLQNKIAGNAKQLKTGLDKPTTQNGKKEEILPEGSIADYQKQISELNKQISLSIDPASIAAMTEQIKDLELKIWDLKVRARIEGDRDSFDTMVSNIEAMPITVDVKVNPKLEGLKNLKLGTAKWYQDIIDSQNASKKLAQQLSGVAEVGRAASSAFSAMGEAMESPALNIAAIIAGAIANVMAGYAQATAKAGSTAVSPWEWAAFAISGLATAIATVSQIKQVTAFADGGVVSGPTMALVGEYAGARNNPEVIAPLNKLRDLLPEPGAGVQRVEVTGRLRGADIVLASSNYNNISKRSRH